MFSEIRERFAPRALMAALTLHLAAGPGAAQTVGVERLPELGGSVDEEIRTDQTLGLRATEGYLVRSPSTLLTGTDDPVPGTTLDVLVPTVETSWNSDLPWSFNDGGMWSGRGLNVRAAAGVRVRRGPFVLILAPALIHQENRPFQVVHPRDTDGGEPEFWANPFHPAPGSLDAPLRFGPEPRTRLVPGQSSVTVSTGAVSFGAATENLWWGPGLQNAIVLSDHAEGVPHLFLRTRAPLETAAGAIEGRWILGRLEESDFFDGEPDNDHRTLSGLIVTLSPSPVPDLTLGAARIVVAPLERGDTGLGAALDVLRNVGRPNASEAGEAAPGPDQVFSLFLRWVFPASGLEAWGEWARFEQPASLRDLLELPQHSQGYTAGLQWARPLAASARFRVQAEATFLEPSSTFHLRPVFSSYTSRAIPHGFTHRGQVLGASIGSGASSQWLALDYARPGWRLGVWGRRVRWENAALFTDVVPDPKREDVTLAWGIRGGVEKGSVRVDGVLGTSVRYNYLFQAFQPDLHTGAAGGVDVVSHTLRISVSGGSGG